MAASKASKRQATDLAERITGGLVKPADLDGFVP
jgi:hypothetical protein